MIDRYGPIVIIAPDQVHTNDDNAMKIIYNRKSLKTRFYEIRDLGKASSPPWALWIILLQRPPGTT